MSNVLTGKADDVRPIEQGRGGVWGGLQESDRPRARTAPDVQQMPEARKTEAIHHAGRHLPGGQVHRRDKRRQRILWHARASPALRRQSVTNHVR